MTTSATFTGVGEWLMRREELSPNETGLIDVASGARLTYRALAAFLAERHGIHQGDRATSRAVQRVV